LDRVRHDFGEGLMFFSTRDEHKAAR
jgi:hypothetical protein